MLPKMIALVFLLLVGTGLYLWLDPSTFWQRAAFPFVALAFVAWGVHVVEKFVEEEKTDAS